MRDASVAGDSLFGREGRGGDRVAIAIAEIDRLERPTSGRPRESPGAVKIGLYIIAGLVIAVLLLAGATVGSVPSG